MGARPRHVYCPEGQASKTGKPASTLPVLTGSCGACKRTLCGQSDSKLDDWLHGAIPAPGTIIAAPASVPSKSHSPDTMYALPPGAKVILRSSNHRTDRREAPVSTRQELVNLSRDQPFK
jgi:hypothetical protein